MCLYDHPDFGEALRCLRKIPSKTSGIEPCNAPRLKVGNKWDWTSVGGNWKHILLHLLIACTCSHSHFCFDVFQPIWNSRTNRSPLPTVSVSLLVTQLTNHSHSQHMSQLGFNRFNISLKLLFQIFFFGGAASSWIPSPFIWPLLNFLIYDMLSYKFNWFFRNKKPRTVR